MDGARRVMTKVYAFAKPEEIDLKVRTIFSNIKFYLTNSVTLL